MKILHWITCLLLLFFTQALFSQTYIFQVKDGENRWTCYNLKGEIINPTKFTKCYPFSDNRAVVYENFSLQCFIINEKGTKIPTEVSNYKIDEGESIQFSNGLLAIKNKKWGYMDTTGKLVIPLKYDKAGAFKNGYTIVESQNKFIIINTTGKETPVTVVDIKDLKPIKEGFAPFQSSKNNLFGFIDTTGNIAIEPTFLSVGYFSGGIAWAKTVDEKVGFIDTKGNWIISPKFDYVRNFDPESGLARIKIGDKWAYTNKTGSLLYVATDVFGDFSEGLAKGELRDKSGFFDKRGQWVISPQFEDAQSFNNGYAAVKKDGKWGIINKDGKYIIQPTYYFIKML